MCNFNMNVSHLVLTIANHWSTIPASTQPFQCSKFSGNVLNTQNGVISIMHLWRDTFAHDSKKSEPRVWQHQRYCLQDTYHELGSVMFPEWIDEEQSILLRLNEQKKTNLSMCAVYCGNVGSGGRHTTVRSNSGNRITSVHLAWSQHTPWTINNTSIANAVEFLNSVSSLLCNHVKEYGYV